jgi:hypothetical protein
VPGDRIVIKQGTSKRSLTVLRLKLGLIDRVGDRVQGKATAGRTVRLRVDRCALGEGFNPDGCADALTLTVVAGSGGTYAFDTTGDVDLRGRDLVSVIVRTSAGDRFLAGRPVPVFFLRFGEATVHGLFGPGGPVEFELLEEPGGAVKGTVALPSLQPSDQFTDEGGEPVHVAAGDQVVGDFATDGKMVIPAMITDVLPGSDVITATCFANQPYRIDVSGGPDPDGGAASGVAGPGGAISDDVTEDGIDLGPGSAIELECMSRRGDSIEQDLTVGGG